MPTIQSRISVVAERPIVEIVEALAKRDGVSVSHKARDLLLHAIELVEDEALEALARKRMESRAPGIPLDRFERERRRRKRR